MEKLLVLVALLGTAALTLLIVLAGGAGTSDFVVVGVRCLTCHALPGV